jgi:MFS family permease
MYGIASVVAPLLGGAFTTGLTWRWCFYINLPIGVSAIISMALFFHPPRNSNTVSTTWREKVEQLDLLGTTVLIPTIICLLLALQWGGSTKSWSSSIVVALLVVAGAGSLVFIAIQVQKRDKATVPPRIIQQRSVACSALYVFCAGGCLNVFQYFVSDIPSNPATFSPSISRYN